MVLTGGCMCGAIRYSVECKVTLELPQYVDVSFGLLYSTKCPLLIETILADAAGVKAICHCAQCQKVTALRIHHSPNSKC